MKGKVALVTGASSGIGVEIAKRLSAAGASVVVNSSSSIEAGRRVASTFSRSIYIRADVGEDREARSLVADTVDHFGHLDYVINNAGRIPVIDHVDLEAADAGVWWEALNTNLLGTWNVSRAAVPFMKKEDSQGVIVNMASGAGVRAVGASIPYSVSKAAVIHLTKLMANVLGPHIRVNAVAPGIVDTPPTAGWRAERSVLEEKAPLRRVGTPGDVADAVVFLLECSYVTGEIIVLDGGIGLANR